MNPSKRTRSAKNETAFQTVRTITTHYLGWCLLAVLLAGVTGCGSEATLVRQTEQGGLVSYAFHTEGEVLSSAGRREALRVIAENCPRGSRIVREGEISNVNKTADRAWRGQIGMNRLWGVQFECQ
jgi:hypothetical protein